MDPAFRENLMQKASKLLSREELLAKVDQLPKDDIACKLEQFAFKETLEYVADDDMQAACADAAMEIRKLRGEIAITDHGRILEFPVSNLVIKFSCKSCNLEARGHLLPGELVKPGFGRCPRCKGAMVAGHASMDFDRVIKQLQETGTITISWMTPRDDTARKVQIQVEHAASQIARYFDQRLMEKRLQEGEAVWYSWWRGMSISDVDGALFGRLTLSWKTGMVLSDIDGTLCESIFKNDGSQDQLSTAFQQQLLALPVLPWVKELGLKIFQQAESVLFITGRGTHLNDITESWVMNSLGLRFRVPGLSTEDSRNPITWVVNVGFTDYSQHVKDKKARLSEAIAESVMCRRDHHEVIHVFEDDPVLLDWLVSMAPRYSAFVVHGISKEGRHAVLYEPLQGGGK